MKTLETRLEATFGSPLKKLTGAARALLGHRSLGIADTCAELDQALAVKAARKLG